MADGNSYSRSKKKGYLEAFPIDTGTSSSPWMCDEPYPDEIGCANSVSDTLEGPQSINRCFEADVHEDRTTLVDGISKGRKAITMLKLKFGRLGRTTSQKEVNEIIGVLSLPSFRLGDFFHLVATIKIASLKGIQSFISLFTQRDLQNVL